MLHILQAVLIAQDAAADPPKWMQLAPFALMLVVVYFLMLRPAWKQSKTQQTMLSGLKKDDEVVTTGGLYGRIFSISDKVVTLEIAKDTRIKLLRSAIAGKWNPDTEKAAEAAKPN